MILSTIIAENGTGSTNLVSRVRDQIPPDPGGRQFFPPCRVRWDKRARVLAFLSLALLPLLALARPSDSASVSHRHLFVIEKSRAMHRRLPAVQSVLQELVLSGMQRQLREGDSLGVWTFSDELHTGEFPLQMWSTNASKTIAQRIAYFIQSGTNEGVGQIEKVLPALQNLVEDSEFLTIVLFTSGDHPFAGTPFDGQINETFRAWQAEQNKAQMPFITVLRASGSKMVHCSVTPAPWPVELPPLPAELRARLVSAAKKPVARQRPQTPPPAARPLVFSGSDPIPAHKEADDVAEQKPEPIRTVAAEMAKPLPQAENKAEAAHQSAAPASPVPPKPEVSGPVAPQAPATIEPLNSAAGTALPEGEPKPAQSPATGTPTLPWASPPMPEEPKSGPVAVAAASPTPSKDVGSEAPQALRTVQETTRANIPSSNNPPMASKVLSQPGAALGNINLDSNPPILEVHARALTDRAGADPSPAVVGAAPQAPPWVQRAVAITGAALALTAVALFFLRKPRPARGSLITRSLDRDFGR